MSCVIWTEPQIEAACREWVERQRELAAAPKKTPLKRLAVLARRVERAKEVAADALSSTVERAVALRDLRLSVVLGGSGVFVHEHPQPQVREWQVY